MMSLHSDDAPYNASAAAPALLVNLNPEQLAAVTLPARSALILAGAGSGKTRVLTTRIAWLIHTGQLSPGGVMAVTFTNKAAKEMLARLSAMLPVPVRGMWIGTFHGLCNRFLRAHWKLANLPQSFQILDTQDQLSAIKRLMKQFNIDEERSPAKETQWFIAGCKEDGLRPGDVTTRSEEDRKKVEIYQLYEDQCQREGVVDFAELMLRSYELLRDNDPIREHYRRRFHHILVDEFQDTNKLQYAWLKMFAGDANAVFAVGDDDQSIYAFRGAHRHGRGSVDGGGDPPALSRRRAAARDRGALSQQRAEPGDRDVAVQCGRALPRVRRPALLRARRDQARAVLPAPAGEPERR